jgi:hypothetical protein
VGTGEFLGLWIDNNWNYCEVVPVCGLTWKVTIHDKHTESMTTFVRMSEWGWRQHVHLKCWHYIPEIDSHHHGHCSEGLTYCCLGVFSSRGWASSCNFSGPENVTVSLDKWFLTLWRIVPPSCSRVRQLLLRRLCQGFCVLCSCIWPYSCHSFTHPFIDDLFYWTL